jgi:hypothetical protein
MSEMNGQEVVTITDDEEELAIRDLKRLAARAPIEKSIAVMEAVEPALAPFEQQTHTLMIESVDRIAQGWIEQLGHVRNNTVTIEQLVIERATLVKEQITKLHLLGAQVMKEAERGKQVNTTLVDQLDRMAEE